MRLVIILFVLFFYSCKQDSGFDFVFHHDGKDRIYNYYVPKNFKKNSPAIFVFHGWGGTSKGTMNFMQDVHQFHDLADKYGYMIVYPEGLPNDVDHLLYNSDPNNSGNWWCSDPNNPICSNDDADFARELAKYFIKRHDLDSSKIYATGYSMGGVASWIVNQQAGDVFKGAAPFGAVNGGEKMGMKFPSKQAFPILMFDGLADPFGMQEGTEKGQEVMYKIWLPEHADLTVLPYTRKEIFEYYANLANCQDKEVVSINDINTLTKYSKCNEGVLVWRYEVQNYGHEVPSLKTDEKNFSTKAGIDMGQAVFEFFNSL